MVFTDSKNACFLLDKKHNNNFLISKILTTIQNSQIDSIIFIWCPAHIGLDFNEKADILAKRAVTEGQLVNHQLTITDACTQIYNMLWLDWSREFSQTSQVKGIWFSQFFPTPPRKYWFSNSNMESKHIKVINRLFTNHTYGKKYLKLIKSEQSDICDTCNIQETENHSIFNCSKYTHLKANFKFFNKYNNLQTLLKSFKIDVFNELVKFIQLAKITL